jgi:hypothetical protein
MLRKESFDDHAKRDAVPGFVTKKVSMDICAERFYE